MILKSINYYFFIVDVINIQLIQLLSTYFIDVMK